MWADDVMKCARNYAQRENEAFGSKHVWWAMDRLIPGNCYGDNDSLDEKLIALENRAAVYLGYDRLIVRLGQAGNSEVDASVKRLAIYDAQVPEIKKHTKNEEERLLAFLSLLCRTNSLFLGRETLSKDFTWSCHSPIFDFFVIKDAHLSIAKQDSRKNRLLMMGRGSFKSSCNIVDCLSWVLAVPSIRIVILTATVQLAKSFVQEVRSFFRVDDVENITSPFQAIFASDIRFERTNSDGTHPRANFLISEVGKENEMICPARATGDALRRKEPTILASSIGTARSGIHCDCLKGDDVISEVNSETVALTEKVIRKIGMISKLCDPGSFRDFIGTSYTPEDFYAKVRSNPEDFVLLIKPAQELRVDPNGMTAIQRGKPVSELEAVDWTVTFAFDKCGREKLSWKFLQASKRDDPLNYNSQYLLDPRGARLATFSDWLIQERMIPRELMRQQATPYARYLLADLAYTAEDYSDFSVIAFLEVDSLDCGYVTELVRGKFIPSDIVYQLAEMNHRLAPQRILIEDSKGCSHLRGELERAAKDLGDQISLEFIPVDNRKGSKSLRISRLEPRLQNRRLFFLNTLNHREELISEFVNYPAKNDDIPDCLALCEHVLGDARPAPADSYAQAQAERILQAKESYEKYFGNPEAYIDMPLDPLPGTEDGGGTGGADLWDPFSPGGAPYKN